MILPISASQEARITGMSHQCSARDLLFHGTGECFVLNFQPAFIFCELQLLLKEAVFFLGCVLVGDLFIY
jgi:hypothetical protein